MENNVAYLPDRSANGNVVGTLPDCCGSSGPIDRKHSDVGRVPPQHPGRNAPKHEQLEYLLGHFTQFDLLTNLPNRSQFIDRLGGALARARNNERAVGVMLLDLDSFRDVNVEHGYRNGDAILKLMGARLNRCMQADEWVARRDGDEFSVIFEGLSTKRDADIKVNRILKAVAQPLAFADVTLELSASAGVALHPLDAYDIDALLHHAETALVDAKRRCRGACQFYSTEWALRCQADGLNGIAARDRLTRLTPREREVLKLVVAGNANKMMGYLLGVSRRTVEIHRGRVMKKMGARSLPELVRMVIEATSEHHERAAHPSA